MPTHTLFPSITPDDSAEDTDSDEELCGAEMSDGSTCERLADECPYDSHSDN